MEMAAVVVMVGETNSWSSYVAGILFSALLNIFSFTEKIKYQKRLTVPNELAKDQTQFPDSLWCLLSIVLTVAILKRL